jgi:transcriptional regulator with XRE-family HTH domain
MISKKLKEFRLKHKKSTQEMAGILELTLSEYADIELNMRVLSGSDLDKIFTAIPGTSIDDFVTVKQFDMKELEPILKEEFEKLRQALEVDQKKIAPYLQSLNHIPLDILNKLIDVKDPAVFDRIRLILAT